MTPEEWLALNFPEIDAIRQIGQGGQKKVFQGVHQNEGQIVLKLFHPSADSRRATREIEAVRQIVSPHIPDILAIGSTDSPWGDIVWIREQFVEGESLRQALNAGPLSDEMILRIAVDLMEVLSAAEEVRIVHRDVKPENIIVHEDNTWLLDFGIARHLDEESLTATGQRFGVGTLGYAPPEQLRNVKPGIDGRADLFALGITLYECVEGTNPLTVGARDQLEVLRRTEKVPLSRISRDVLGDQQFGDLIYALTRPRRDHRPVSVADALTWIREIRDRAGI